MKITPTIIIPKSKDNRLTSVMIEKYENYDILWYYWPYDGNKHMAKIFFDSIEDYEPIIIVYQNKTKICNISTRVGWMYRSLDVTEDEVFLPLHILFRGENHHPLIKAKYNIKKFNNLQDNTLVCKNYKIIKINANNIPYKFRQGRGHPTNWRILPVEDPADYAERVYQLCYK